MKKLTSLHLPLPPPIRFLLFLILLLILLLLLLLLFIMPWKIIAILDQLLLTFSFLLVLSFSLFIFQYCLYTSFASCTRFLFPAGFCLEDISSYYFFCHSTNMPMQLQLGCISTSSAEDFRSILSLNFLILSLSILVPFYCLPEKFHVCYFLYFQSRARLPRRT